MEISRKQKIFLIAGPLALGVLGNALWDVARPVARWLWTAVVDLTSFGVQRLQDDIYVEAARGSYERAGPLVLTILISALLGFTSMVLLLRLRDFRRKRADVLDPNSAEGVAANTHKKKKLARPMLVMAIFMLGCAVTILSQVFRMVYVIRVANYLEQLQHIAAPFVSEAERLQFASKVASMRSEADYLAIKSRLCDVVRSSGNQVPPP
jgi:hypothetical protein